MCPLDLAGALKALLVEVTDTELTETAENVKNGLMNNTIQLEVAINLLSEHILNVENAKLYKTYLSNTLLALVSAKIPLAPVFSSKNYNACSDEEKITHLEFSLVLAALCDHPDILQYTLKYFEINPVPPFDVYIHHEDTYNVAPKKRRLANCRQTITVHQIITCSFTLFAKLPNALSYKWDWTKLIENFSGHENSEIRWMVKECMAMLTNMTEAQSAKLANIMNIPNDAIIKWNHEKVTIVRAVDEVIKDQLLNKTSIVNIDGIMLPVYDRHNIKSGKLFPAKSTTNNLRSLALAVSSGKAVLLLGPVGSGKTSLVEHLAEITGRKGVAFKKVQLGDQTDSRMLLGSHQCTDVPGEFIWRPGVLTEAVQNGHWLLLEDIDTAALDVASTLSSMLERNTLCVPGYRDSLAVAPNFHLFVTQRTLITNYGFQKKMSNSSTLLQKHLTQINVEPLSRSELTEIIQKLFPNLATISSKMIEVFMMFSVGSHDTSLQSTDIEASDKDHNINMMRGSRQISTRDLLKWCQRSVQGFDVASSDSGLKVLQDALDIFTCSISNPENRLELAKKVGTLLGIVETKSEFYCKHYKPNVSLSSNTLDVGRAKVPRIQKSLESTDLDNKQVVFSFTRQSASLLERIACCVTSNEPVLLVGETGTGKTSSVQYLARQTGHKLVVINMNQQSDSADLLGGYKPVDMKYVIQPIKSEFGTLFCAYYNVEKNKKFLGHIETCYDTENWTALLALMTQSHKSAVNRLITEKNEETLKAWQAFGHKLTKLELQVKAASKLTFAFIEGSLVKAMQEGHWVLLDEINLASAEILECLAGLLEDKSESIDLIEKGDKMPIKRHHDFTLFACMNPATDVGKKDLPPGLRNRFTEFFVDELTEKNDLMLLIGDYLYHMNLSGSVLESIYQFYSNIKKEARISLVDGAGNVPHFSLRTLCRALTAAAKAKCSTVARSLYEAFCLSFLTQLDSSSHPKVEAMIAKAVLSKKSVKSVLNQLIPEPQIPGQNFLLFEGHWIPQGKLEIAIPEGYILTPTVRKNLRDIARIISLSRLPVLLQGDTSVGKTSLITYIAKASGNYCVRINNHEHTDLQEYIGSYASDASGKLVFKEGVLVEAMRKGYWIILDELNLAPSDVLEALNRVLDDNRELFIPETQQVIKADPNFMLFATQNPPGLYGGRKMLSRAFRNRFVELHFDEIPKTELETILHQRCQVPPAYCKKMIAVMSELQIRRRGSAAVQGKDGFITLRDLFRWGQRYKLASQEMLTGNNFYDWEQHIADEGYLILAGKVRQSEERSIIEEVIEKQIKRKVTPSNLFDLHQSTSPVTKSILENVLNNQLEEFSHVVWTYNMRRLAVLISKAFIFDEPVLLVGETGCGKTTICQVLATLSKRQLLSVNCHMHTESSDFLGGLRPVRQYKNDGRMFEWVDGPLVKAMQSGHLFLADEISLADDSVLERMNSLLEPERQLVLAERGVDENSDIVVITANKSFHFIGTMNPGGDFGKKELSPALRNRFTEIWCDSFTSRQDLLKVLEKNVNSGISFGNQEDGSSGIGSSILDFTDWLKLSEVTNKFPFSIRDLLSWVQFINAAISKGFLDTPEAYVHGACMTFLDCFGTTLTGHIESDALAAVRKSAIDFLLNQIKIIGNEYTQSLREMLSDNKKDFVAEADETKFGIKPFYIDIGPHVDITEETDKFTFTAPTTGSNTLRLLRGLQLNKAILLEGNPGVGKTSLVTALAKSSGHKVVRINLSDQTDITDLFGTDLPTDDGSFTFKEGIFLNALQNGHWILLDELNLAPQPVLEGLNACLDHRGEVFIPELGKTFKVKKQTRLFACQNPLKQGGARRGLPVSFLNRFTQVYIDVLTQEDLSYIVNMQYPSICKLILDKIVLFNCTVAQELTEKHSWGHTGGPWEMNLRDIQRWCDALIKDQNEGIKLCPGKFADMLYINRMRTAADKEKMIKKFENMFLPLYPLSQENPQFIISDSEIIIGDVCLERNVDKWFQNRRIVPDNIVLLRHQMITLKALAQSVKMNWLSILVGPTATGKSTMVQILADLTGNDLQVIPVTSAMDVSDLLGGFEQLDYNKNLESLYDKIESLTIQILRKIWLEQDRENWTSNKLLTHLYQYRNMMSDTNKNNKQNDITVFKEKIQFLLNHMQKLTEYSQFFNAISKKLQEVINDLKRLEFKVAKESTVNTGGKFEWVDSLLVKTMLEGSWLLLDNVNLTSAAVLDRLNGLLEPNGVLSIPERGEMSEIRPHPNFRIFFTMDPKYGEISRAMRNRGVETYILRSENPDAYLVDTIPYMDLSALLSSCGLHLEQHELMIKCHESMTSFIQGIERPNLSHLLQAAQLTSQQLIRAIPLREAVVNSFSDVYIKPRCGSDFVTKEGFNLSLAEMKNEMLLELTDVFRRQKIKSCTSDSHSLSVKGICNNSLLEIAKQLAFSVIYVSENWDSMEKMMCIGLYNLYIAYQRCPTKVLSVLYEIIKQTYEARNDYGNTWKNFMININDMVYNYLLDYTDPTESNSSQDASCQLFYAEFYTVQPEDIINVNLRYVLLFISLRTYYFTYLKQIKQDAPFSFLDYSEAVLAGNLTDDFDEYPLIKHCKTFLDVVDEYVERGIRQGQPLLDQEGVALVYRIINWRFRFYRACTSPMFDSKEGRTKTALKEDNMRMLYLHSKWLYKFLMRDLYNVLPSFPVLDNEFVGKLEDVLSDVDYNGNKMCQINNDLRKQYGIPSLIKDQNEFELCTTRVKDYKRVTLDLNQPLEKQFDRFIGVSTDKFYALDVPDENSPIFTVGKFQQKKDLTDESARLLRVKHLPINTYILYRIMTLLKNELRDTARCFKDLLNDELVYKRQNDVLLCLTNFGAGYSIIPPELMNILLLLRNAQISRLSNDLRVSTVYYKFWDQYYKVLSNSPALYPLPFFNINSLNNEVTESIPMNSKKCSMHLPLLPYYVHCIASSKDDDASHVLAYETISIEDRKIYSLQLDYLSSVIWKNINIMDIAAQSDLEMGRSFELHKYEEFILNFHRAVNILLPEAKLPRKAVDFLKVHFEYDVKLARMITDSYKVYVQLNNETNKTKVKVFTAQLRLLTSILLVKVVSEIKPYDHVEKIHLKYRYLEEDLEMFDTLMGAYYFNGLVFGALRENKMTTIKDITRDRIPDIIDNLQKVHPICEHLYDLRSHICDSIVRYRVMNTFRPKEPTYDSFTKYCKNFAESVLSIDTVSELVKNLIQTSNKLTRDLNKKSPGKTVIESAGAVINEAASWLHSVNTFYQKLESDYAEAFPELAKPLLSSISQTVYGVTCMKDLIKELVVKVENGKKFRELVTDLMLFPNTIPKREHNEKHLNRFLSSDLIDAINKAVVVSDESIATQLEKMRLLKMNLTELSMYCTAFESIDSVSLKAVKTTLGGLVDIWQQQQMDIEKKKQDDEALYVTKSKCEDEDDEAIAQEEVKEMFPSYTEGDFGEFKPSTLEKKHSKTQESKSKPKQVITSDDVTLVYKWHSDFVRNLTRAEWLPTPKKSLDNDVTTPLLLRYSIFSSLIDNSWEALDVESEPDLIPGFLVILSHIKAKVDGKDDTNSKIDFYRSPWVSQTSCCVPLLQQIKENTDKLLEQWPDFPTLKDIKVIINRILSFPIKSPVSRFLTGLELLRDKIEEWNKNAHKGNNLVEDSLQVGQQIINWRKLEMAHWKECLNNMYQRKQAEAHKYWFYLYNVVKSYLQVEENNEPIPASRMISVLKDFMEKSNLVEYSVRLDIIYVYHCQLVHMEPSERRDELLSILWNTFNYYSQFNAQVTSTIKEKRVPIEKKLRDFVKICSWDRDLSYWSVKDTVEKAHKTLHKQTKEFENVLKESVAPCLIDKSAESGSEHVGIWDRPKRFHTSTPTGGAYMVDTQNFVLLVRNVKKYLDAAEQQCKAITDGSLLSKVGTLVNKAKVLCKKTFNNTGYPSLVQGLDDFVTLIIDTSTHLGSLEVDASSPKDKQISQAKSFVQQKRKALADLFKYLAKIGLNYRTGLVILTASGDDLYDFTIPPVDLDAAMSHLKSRRCDSTLSLLWSGCENYFQKNIARHRFLATALQSPHQDLGIQNIERCKGFAAHLMKLSNTQKKSISKYSRHLYDLRTVTTNLINVVDIDKNDTNVLSKIDILIECYAQCSIALDQFIVLWKSLPDTSAQFKDEIQFDSGLSTSIISKCYKNNGLWHQLYVKMNSIIAEVSKQKTILYKLVHSNPKQIGQTTTCVPVISQSHIDIAIDGTKHLNTVVEAIDDIIQTYEYRFRDPILEVEEYQHPILNILVEVREYLQVHIKKLNSSKKPNDVYMENDNLNTLIDQTEDLLATMLLVIQSIYKKHLPKDQNESAELLNAIDEIIDKEVNVEEQEESKELLQDKHLKDLLHDKLSNDAKLLQLETLINKIQTLVGTYMKYIACSESVTKGKEVVMRLVPILEQVVLFVQYFITQKVAVHRVTCKMLSVLLKIFSDLATKGFCKPSDLDVEEGDGDGGPGKLSSGTGLGEGEGQKDVSDKIENQDQLEDANRPGEEKKEEDRDCKEEEKGVNMTDDFDSHLQDVDKKDDDTEKDDDEDDADKQMGDTDNAAEKLDQQIWGSEDEEDIDEEHENKKDEKGQGENTGEKEIGAKDEEQGADDGAEGKDQKKKKDINEMNEPEVDDDQVDPYHGNQQPHPEPEDFELPENMDLDGNEDADKDGETETENPFELDVPKDDIPKDELENEEEDESAEEKDNKHGFEVSSDEEDGEGDNNDKTEDKEQEEKDKGNEEPDETEPDAKSDESDGMDVDPEDKLQDTPQETEELEQAEESPDKEELPKNPDNIEDEEVEQKTPEANPQANPSNNDPTAEDRTENAEMDKGTNDNVETNAEQKKDEDAAPFEQAQEQVGEDQQSMGRSELDKSEKGHRGDREKASQADSKQEKQKKRENKPGKTDQERTLGDVNEKKHKQSKTLNIERDEEPEEDGDGQEDKVENDADAYQHIKQGKKDDLQAIDAATKEQADQQPTLQQEDEEAEELTEDDDIAMDVDEEELLVEKSEELKSEKIKEGTDKEKEKTGNKNEGGEDRTGETGVEVEGEKALTSTVPRGMSTTYHTRMEQSQPVQTEEMSLEQYMNIRQWLTSGQSQGNVPVGIWRTLWQESAPAARALCERLRLVLEPTGRSRKAGDFRTGRSINMRRVIPYIASHFRKDRIWLRRTKPAKREYKIAIAIDDSSSMSDNRSKELAFESLALVSQALNLLESGDLAVLSFGEKPNLLHPFTEQFSEHSGSKILEQLRFEQTKTKVAQLLDFCTVLFDEQTVRSDALNAKLLVIVSDGRGIFSEGETKVIQSVRRARQQGVFVVYVIIDNPDNKDSIMDIRRPLLDPTTNALTGFVPYLDTFPFPFYLILRDMSALPTVLGDALRQWFELAANTAS